MIKNWKPLSFDKIAESPLVTVSDILGELTTVATLRIQIFRYIFNLYLYIFYKEGGKPSIQKDVGIFICLCIFYLLDIIILQNQLKDLHADFIQIISYFLDTVYSFQNVWF